MLPVITIDGPAGAGKTSIAKAVAAALGFNYLDTGAMYRAIALALHRKQVPLEDSARLLTALAEIQLDVRTTASGTQVFIDGEDVSLDIREPFVSRFASQVSAIPEVRRRLVQLQRQIGQSGGIVVEGRDMGTVVFPDAILKIFLSATVEERARRRCHELRSAGKDVNFEDTLNEIAQRDQQDSTRADSPLRKAVGAVEVDSTNMRLSDVVALVLAQYRVKSY